MMNIIVKKESEMKSNIEKIKNIMLKDVQDKSKIIMKIKNINVNVAIN